MFAICVYDLKKGKQGWLKTIKTHTGQAYLDKYSGLQRFEPVVVNETTNCRTWKTADGAIKYADTLASRLETIEYLPHLITKKQYKHQMKYMLDVIDIYDNNVIHRINNFEYSADR